MPKFTKQSREPLHDFGFFSVVHDTVIEETTDTTFERNGVSHIGAVAVVPYYENGDVVLIEQYRVMIDEMSIEVVAGRRDVVSEAPIDCARRELLEEVGITSSEIIPLGYTYASPGISDEKLYLYMARGCSDIGENEPDGIEEQFAQSHRVSLETALEMAHEGRIVDSKSIVTLFRAAHLLGF